MNRHNIFLRITGFFALAVMACGCSLLEKFEKPVQKEAVLPTDKEQIMTDRVTKTYTPEELSHGIVRGDWAIESVYGKQAVGETAPYLRFEASEKRMYGNNGCNTVNATYQYNPADSTLQFSHILSTMMACAKEGITDYDVNRALNATRFYKWELKGSEYWVWLLDENHTEVMALMHQNFSFLNGAWSVVAINEEPTNNADMQLVFDVDEHKIHGNTGCNILNGTFETDFGTANSISFQAIGLTKMACDDPSRETQFVVALEDASHARPVSADRVLLLDNDGATVLTLVREKLQQK